MPPKKRPGLGDLVLEADAADQRFAGGQILAPVKALETREDFAAAISALWRSAQENFISIGRRLNEAKMRLPHGEFEAMVAADMPFTVSMARRLRAVAEAIDSGAAPVDHLPTNPTIIYEVMALTEQERQAGIAAGVIRPDMRREDIRAFKIRARQPAPAAPVIDAAPAPPPAVKPCAGARFDDRQPMPISPDPVAELDALRARRAELAAEIARIDERIKEAEKRVDVVHHQCTVNPSTRRDGPLQEVTET